MKNLKIDYSNPFNSYNTIAVIDNQFGDCGKGKIVYLLALRADIIYRVTGGHNAGHTIIVGEKTYVFHILPSGICYDKDGKVNIIGNGTVIYPKILCDELGLLDKDGLTYNNLLIALNANLILPQHILLDRLKECHSDKTKIGTTGKGIGPAYTDKTSRCGLIMNDLLNKDVFVEKLRNNLKQKQSILKQYDPNIIKEIMNHEDLENGLYFQENGDSFFNEEAIVDKYMAYGKKLSNMIVDVDGYLRENLGKKKILVEGAQGLLLSVDYGTYPYVTSSDPSIRGSAKGAGLTVSDIDFIFGIIKGFYMTRVGEGPFPTEMGGLKSDVWCNRNPLAGEKESKMTVLSVNDPDEFRRGMAIRREGNEIGATSGRPRRVGRLDMVLLRYSLNFLPGKNLINTKLDVLNGCKVIEICDYYIYDGPDMRLGEIKLTKGYEIHDLSIVNSEILQHCKPHYIEFSGWECSLDGCRTYEDFPQKLKDILDYIAKDTGANHCILSIGPKSEQTVFM